MRFCDDALYKLTFTKIHYMTRLTESRDHSFCNSLSYSFWRSRNSQTVIGRRPHMLGMAKADSPEVTNFWCWSESRCGSSISTSLFLTLGARLFTIYFHSPGDDTAAALRYMLTYHRATMQRPWRRLRRLIITYIITYNEYRQVHHF